LFGIFGAASCAGAFAVFVISSGGAGGAVCCASNTGLNESDAAQTKVIRQ
jgi:hypothetical protein